MTAAEVIRLLELEPLPHEGGFFRQTYRSSLVLPPEAFPAGLYRSPRAAGTAIYAVLTPEHLGFSALHRLRTDEVWHFYAGDAFTHLGLFPDGRVERFRLGGDFAAGERPQLVAPAGVWQGALPESGGRHGWSLIGCTMAPEFAWEDFELGSRAELLRAYPGAAAEIGRMTRG
jgi:uncharacterized protein